jgi:hypothetical protein
MADLVSRPSTEVDPDEGFAPVRRQAHEPAEQARKQPDEPGDKPAALPLPAFEPGDPVRQFAHELRQLAGDIYKADRLRAGAAADAREASGAAHDPTIYNADMERAVSDRAAREHATYRYEMAPVPDRRVIDEAFGDLARNIPTPEQRVRNTMDVPTAKAEVAQGKQDLRAARQERADGDLLQQTLTIGRQVEAARKAEQPAEQKAEIKGRRMRV